MVKVSVVIPTYKPQEYIFDCLDALSKQSLDRSYFEVIIIINGCKEPYESRIKDYIRNHKFSNFHTIQTDVPGVSNARNLGLKESSGEYLVFIDDDDIVSSQYLEGLLNVSTPCCIGCSNSFSFRQDIREKEENFITQAYRKNLNKRFNLVTYKAFLSPPVCKMIHRDIIKDSIFPETLKRSEDSVFCLSLSPRIHDMQLAASDTIYYIRKREGSATREKFSYRDEFLQLLKIEKEYFRIWIKAPLKYNFIFFISRVLAGFYNSFFYIREDYRKKKRG